MSANQYVQDSIKRLTIMRASCEPEAREYQDISDAVDALQKLYDQLTGWTALPAGWKATEAPTPLGELHEPRALFMCEYLGRARDPATGNEYEIQSALGSRAPMILSKQSNRTYMFDLLKLLNYAVEAGLDNA